MGSANSQTQKLNTMSKQTSVEWLFKKLWEEPKDKLTWYSILRKAEEMHYKETMEAMQKGMELQEKENNRIGFRERIGLLPKQETLYTEEQVKEAMFKVYVECENRNNYFEVQDEIIQSLKQPKKD